MRYQEIAFEPSTDYWRKEISQVQKLNLIFKVITTKYSTHEGLSNTIDSLPFDGQRITERLIQYRI